MPITSPCLESLLGAMIPNHSDTSIDASSTPHANDLSVFPGLIINSNIKHRDPIIFFFAGNDSDYLLSDHDDPDDEDKRDDVLCKICRGILYH